MIDFEFSICPMEMNHIHSDIEIFYVMEGSAQFILEDKQFILNRDDFLVVNIDKNHSFYAEDGFLAAHMYISYSELSGMMKQSMIFFWCNTALEASEASDELRRVIRKIIAEQYHNQGQNNIYLKSLHFEMLNILITDFQLNKKSIHYREETDSFDARRHEIMEYIRNNFDKPITLDDLSKQFFLSYAYLSKYIKRQFGMGFAEYLNEIRPNHAVSLLLHSDQTIVRVALESGFSSSAALNKSFRDKYSMTPTEYRRKWISRGPQSGDARHEEQNIRIQLQKHFSNVRSVEHYEYSRTEESVVMGNTPRRILKKSWNRMINMGTVLDLLQSDMQEHILNLKEELHFEYVRLWDLYAPGLYADNSDSGYFFEKLDCVLDFLLKNGLKPYIELRNKPKRIIQNFSRDILYRKNPDYSENLEETEQFLRRFMIHLLNRYHTDVLESWYFELWFSESENGWKESLGEEADSPIRSYLDRFQKVSQVLREYVPSIRLGGGGFSMRHGRVEFRNMLQEWKGQSYLPDFISLYAYPYTQETVIRERNQSKNADLLRDTLLAVRQDLEETGFPTQELHVSEWNFSVSSRNVLNDHCMKGAYLVRNMIESGDLADMIGYWIGSDLFAAHHSSQQVIDGSGGLLSKDGIRKPAFYAFDFMNHLGKYVRKRGEHYIITDNDAGNWRIVCHNLKNLTHQYGLQQEDEIRISEQNNVFSDLKKYCIHFDLPGKKNGKYTLRIHSLNAQHGSLQDEWMAMSAPQELSTDDLKYLRRITTPRLVLQNCVAENGHIAFDVQMEPNEIAYIHVTYQYGK